MLTRRDAVSSSRTVGPVSLSDAVKKRYFDTDDTSKKTKAATAADCSFATITFPFQSKSHVTCKEALA